MFLELSKTSSVQAIQPSFLIMAVLHEGLLISYLHSFLVHGLMNAGKVSVQRSLGM